MNPKVRYPVGEQSFEQLRRGNFLYVDKTQYIEQLMYSGPCYFLGRPRRFGKSLFLSTLKCFFEGKRELFKGLYIDSVDWDWEPYPVLYLDLSPGDYSKDGELKAIVENQLRKWEKLYSVSPQIDSLSIRFKNVIKAASEKTGKSVVILVDEYEKPLVHSLNDKERFDNNQAILSSLYLNFKSSADYIQLVFLTGVSRFREQSVFSGLNNIMDISLTKKYAAICGITESELLDYFQEGISVLGDEEGLSPEQAITRLKQLYDGYRFSERSPAIYNPNSLLSCFNNEQFGNYWIESGTPTLLIEQLKKTKLDVQSLDGVWRSESDLSVLTFDNVDPVALLYQTGYLTIKSFNSEFWLAQLGFPNEEVSDSFFKFIVPTFANLHNEEVH